MPKQLTTQNATITTAAVEVKALTIGGRQVTQSVYRQLREARLVSYEGTFRGNPWGYVNHCPERQYWRSGESYPCNDGHGHLHVIWQYGGELYRSRVTPPPAWHRALSNGWVDDYAQALYCLNDHSYGPELRQLARVVPSAEFTFDGMDCSAELPESPRKEGHECRGVVDLDACRDGLRSAVGHEYDRRARHKALWQSMKELPQLFIAV
ncbi:hypothetical protein ABZX93_14885 [Streptomyces sp. NPDC006632]|uniref:hypothetical protein n=1 Tax=Streptomyces sp. NPDC006632 TaxID=3157182 RepID=UPI0033A3B915